MWKFTYALFVLALLAVSAEGESSCQLERIASLDIQGPEQPIIVAQINKQPVNMLVDTGGFMTMLTERKADALGLEKHPIRDSQTAFYGGYAVKNFAEIDTFRLGKLQAGKSNYPLMPAAFSDPDEDGIVAPDFLANFDLDFDFANAKLNLFSKDHCDGEVVYWTQTPYANIPILLDKTYHILVNVDLDGQPTQAVIDTGASTSVLSLDYVQHEFRISDDDPALTKSESPNGLHNSRHYPFKHLKFGGVSVENPNFILVPDKESQIGVCPAWAMHTFCEAPPPMILGMNILKQLHLYVAYHEKKLYLTAASAK